VNYLTLENVTKSFGEKILFQDVNLQISKGEKIALVAKNGSGKTTLLRVIAGEETGEGELCNIIKRKDIRIGYLNQEPEFFDDWNIMQTVFDSENIQIKAVRAYEEAMLHPDDTDAMEKALIAMDDQKAWDVESKVKEILFKLNITELDRTMGTLSGGQQKRVALAKILIDEPDFVILDEPTNHLDLSMIEWLEEYLKSPNITLFMVTHDRYFLERVCNHIIELDQGEFFKYSGSYSDFLEKKQLRYENDLVVTDKAKKLMRKELDWIRRMPKARTTKAKSRVDAFDNIKKKATKQIDRDKIQIDIKGTRLGGKILEANYINKKFGDLVIVKDFLYKFRKMERVGIVGKNGVGKTTFLKMLTQEIRPDSGQIVVGGTVKFGYYTQDGMTLDEDKRVIDVVREIAEYIPMNKGQKLTASQLLERFLFPAPQQQVYVSKLSGGERRRLFLLTIIMQNPNFLILDEPTNDLDIVSMNVLEEFLIDFPGCVLVVSHDRYFMDKIIDHLFVFEGEGKIKDYNGNYREYQAQKKEEEKEKKKESSVATKKSLTKAEQTAIPGLTFEEKKEFKKLERAISRIEERRKEINALFLDPNMDQQKLIELGEETNTLKDELEEKEMRWMELAEKMEG
jgi:ATP-binding cassette subfamily F protein uup